MTAAKGRDPMEPITIELPTYRTVLRTSWCRISWIDRPTGPPFRIHFVLAWGPHLWLKIGRLDAAFHRYDNPWKQWR